MRRALGPFVVAVIAVVAVRNAEAQEAPATPAPPAPPAPVVVPEVPPAAAPADAGAEEKSLAGWHGGVFYLRSPDDYFRLYVQGRLQMDMYNYAGPGVTDMTGNNALKSNFFLRRVRPELTGEFMKNWQWMLAGDFGKTTTVTNANGSTSSGSVAAPTDVFINYRGMDGLFNVQVGQYDAPFTMENRTSDKFFAFMERSLAVRVVGVPTNKEIGAMVWGELKNKFFFYSLGVFDGDGQNVNNPDNRFDAMGRLFVHPLAGGSDKNPLKDLQIGGSFRYGMRDKNQVFYDYNSFTTQGGWRFWAPTYKDAGGRTLHVIPVNAQTGFAGELRVPFDQWFDLQSEFVYIDNATRESVEGTQATNTERFGHIKGFSYYVQLGFWPLGNRDVNGAPGYENPTHVDLKKPDGPPKTALQLLLKFEQLSLEYNGADACTGTCTAGGYDGKIKANVLEIGANYWHTKHLRFTVNYLMNMFPDSANADPTTNRAVAPGNTLAKGVNDDAKANAHNLHEILLRAAVAF